jgi:hypothetical protein
LNSRLHNKKPPVPGTEGLDHASLVCRAVSPAAA